MLTTRKVKMTLVGRDGNAFALMSAFITHARRQGWPEEEIEAFEKEATSGNYDHLLSCLIGATEAPERSHDDD